MPSSPEGSEELLSIEYEQCPFDPPHILAIYRNIEKIEDDGQWRRIPCPTPFAQYRVFDKRIFQAVFAHSENLLVEELKAEDPPISQEDAEWTIFRLSDESYSLTSRFTRTFGPFRAQASINDVLQPYGLKLIEHREDVWGAALFVSLESGCFLDAMERLRFLESACTKVNGATERFLAFEWNDSLAALKLDEDEPPSDFIRDLPAQVQVHGTKHREPL